jgi:hypothetical protein
MEKGDDSLDVTPLHGSTECWPALAFEHLDEQKSVAHAHQVEIGVCAREGRNTLSRSGRLRRRLHAQVSKMHLWRTIDITTTVIGVGQDVSVVLIVLPEDAESWQV